MNITTRTWTNGDPEPADVLTVVDRFSRTWEPMDGGLAGLWWHGGEQVTWANLLAEFGPVTEVTR